MINEETLTDTIKNSVLAAFVASDMTPLILTTVPLTRDDVKSALTAMIASALRMYASIAAQQGDDRPTDEIVRDLADQMVVASQQCSSTLHRYRRISDDEDRPR